MNGLSFASSYIFTLFVALAVAQEQNTLASGISSSARAPLFNVKPPLPILNGSAYSRLAPTGTRPRLLTTAASTASSPPASNVATYNGHVFATLCREGDTACLTTCKSYAHSCSADFNSWSALRRSHQSSMADQQNDGSMPVTTSHHIQTEEGVTIWKYETSWLEYRLTTTVEGWGAGSLGMTTTVLTGNDGKVSTSTGFKSGMMDVTYTSSVPIAVGGSGTPISTSEAHYNTFTFEQTSWYDFNVPKPTCSPSSWTDCRYRSDCEKCTISGGTVQLLYFPVPRTEGADTASPATTTSPPTALLETAIYKNITLTSPSVYISFQTAYAQNDCGTQVGKRYPGAILPLPLSDLSSVYGGYGTLYSSDPLAPLGAVSNTPYLAAGQFNLADLNWPPPMSAYTNQLKFALGREIFSIMTQPYNPHLAVPSQVRELDPAWASCGLDWEGLYDPPSALRPASAAAKPTLSSAAGAGDVYESAVPQSSLSSVPVETATSLDAAFFTAPASTDESSRKGDMGESTHPGSSHETATSTTSSIAGRSSVLSKVTSSEGQDQTTQDPQTASDDEGASVAEDTPTPESQSTSWRPSEPEPSKEPVESVESQDPANTDDVTKTVQNSVDPSNVPASEEADAVSADSTVSLTGPSTADAVAVSTSIEVERSTPTVQSLPEEDLTSARKSAQHTPSSRATPAAPLVVAIGSQTVTEGGSVQTVSDEAISLGATKIVVGSSAIGIPRIQAGTQRISLPAGDSAQLMGMTFIAGESPVQAKTTTTASEPKATLDAATLDSTIPRAIFTFGTRTYTAIQTAGTGEAVIGKTTLTAGEAVSLQGGRVSLVSGHLALQTDQTRTSRASKSVATADGAIVTLAHTTVSVIRLGNGNVVYDSNTLSAADSVMTIGSQTFSFGDNDVVVADRNRTTTVQFQRTTFTMESNDLEPKSTTSSEPVPSTTASATRPSGSELPGVTTASATTSSGAESVKKDRGIQVVLVVLLSSLWHWLLLQ